jgi:nucleoside-diphosphate-sugar epimerase
MEMQADTIVRRYPHIRIASLRPHYSVPRREIANPEDGDNERKKDLWGYVQIDSAADAFLRAVAVEERPAVDDEATRRWLGGGHEAFFIVAPTTASETLSEALWKSYWPGVVLKEGYSLSGTRSFFDCRKAERMLGWVHKDAIE